MYRANKVNTPVFKKKGEVQSELVTGSGGAELQLAYSISNNLAVIANGVFDNSKVRVMDTLQHIKNGDSEYSNLFAEGGIGYYKTFGPDTNKMFAVFLGGGYGSTTGYSDVWNDEFIKFNGVYNRIFWQPQYGYILNENVELAGALRFSFLNYHSLSINDGLGTRYSSSSYDIFLEPAVTLKAGYDQFKFALQAGSSIPLKKETYYTTTPLMVSFGFHLNFTRNWKREDDFYED